MNELPPKFIAERIVLCLTCLRAVVYLGLKLFGKIAQPDVEMSMLAMVALLLLDALLASWRRYEEEKAVTHNRNLWVALKRRLNAPNNHPCRSMPVFSNPPLLED